MSYDHSSLNKWQGVHNSGDYQFSIEEQCYDSTYSYVSTIFLNGVKVDSFINYISGDDCLEETENVIKRLKEKELQK